MFVPSRGKRTSKFFMADLEQEELTKLRKIEGDKTLYSFE